jgi:hypothetical protein
MEINKGQEEKKKYKNWDKEMKEEQNEKLPVLSFYYCAIK